MPRCLSLLAVLLPTLMFGCSLFEDDVPVAQLTPARLPEATDFTGSNLLEQFAAPVSEYRLGPGDKLTVTVWGRADISGPQTVGPDGRISIPIGGSLPCSNLTREETEQAIETELLKYYTQVSVTVRVDEYASNRVSVLGNVVNPGSFVFPGPPTLLGALTEAGGLAESKNMVRSPRCSIIRGRTQVVWIDLSELLWHGNIGLNIPLQRDDIVYVPDGTGVMVYVLGEVNSPGVLRLTPGMSIIDAIALAGDMTEDALVDSIRVLRPTESASAEVDFEELYAGDQLLNVELREGDIIYVPTRKLEKWNYFWRKINPFSGLFTVQQNFNDPVSPPGPSTSPAGYRVHALQSVKAHKGLAILVFLLAAIPGFAFAWYRGQPEYVATAAIQVVPNDQSSRFDSFLLQQVLNIEQYEVLEQALVQLGSDRDLWQGPDESDTTAIRRLQKYLEVEEVPGSFQINVSLGGPQPYGLAETVNAVVDAYLVSQRGDSLFAGEDHRKALEDRRSDLMADMDRMAAEKLSIQQEIGVTSFDRASVSPLEGRVSDTRRAVGDARLARITAQSMLDSLDAAERKPGPKPAPLPGLTADQISALGIQSAPLLARRVALQASLIGLTDDNPATLLAQEEIKTIDATLAGLNQEAMAKATAGAEQLRKVQAAQDRQVATTNLKRSDALVTSLEAELDSLQAQLGANIAALERGRSLEIAMDRARRRIDELDDSLDTFRLQSRSPGFERVDSPARTPDLPARGGRMKYLLVFFVLSCGVAIAATVLADMLDKRIHGASDLERAFGFPPLGWIREPTGGEATLQAEDQLRRLALGIEREARRKGTRRLVITSVTPHPRTAGLVADLARELSAHGVRVLSIAGNVNDRAASNGSLGLVDVLEHRADPASVILPGPPGLLPLGAADGLSRLPGSHRLAAVLDEVGRDYDVLLIHAPPLPFAADAELLVSLSDATLLVVRAEEEHLGEVRDVVRLLERLSPPAVGLVLMGIRKPGGTSDSVT